MEKTRTPDYGAADCTACRQGHKGQLGREEMGEIPVGFLRRLRIQ